MDLNSCVCKISPILKYINIQVLDNISYIDLDQFHETLIQTNAIQILEACLIRNGFIGSLKQINNTFFFIVK